MSTRKEMMDFIKVNNLSAAVTAKYGKNFTNCSNNMLKAFIDEYKKGTSKEETKKVTKKEPVITPNADTTKKTVKVDVDNPFQLAFVAMAVILEQRGLLDEVYKMAKEACKA